MVDDIGFIKIGINNRNVLGLNQIIYLIFKNARSLTTYLENSIGEAYNATIYLILSYLILICSSALWPQDNHWICLITHHALVK